MCPARIVTLVALFSRCGAQSIRFLALCIRTCSSILLLFMTCKCVYAENG